MTPTTSQPIPVTKAGPAAFNPAKVGQPGYPSSEASWEARRQLLVDNSSRAQAAGRLHRKGSHNGYRGRRGDAEQEQQEADARACKLVDSWNLAGMTKTQRATYVSCNHPDGDIGDQCMALAVGMAICPAVSATDRLTAAKIVLPFLRTLPTSRSAVTLTTALSFLDDLMASVDAQGVDGGMAAPKARRGS
jgi:hypothetical protein